MTGGIAGLLAFALAFGLAGSALAAARIVDPAAARLAVENPAVLTRDAELAALATSGRADTLAARLEFTAVDPTLGDVAREWLLDRGLHRLAALRPSPAARAAVDRLAARRPTVYARIDPDHGDRAAPLYDVGATARFVRRSWSRADARATAARSLASGDPALVGRYAERAAIRGASPVLSGVADAFAAAPAPQLAAQRPAISAAMADGERVGPLALIVAQRLADPGLFALVLDGAPETSALAAVPAVARTLDARSALTLLERASRRRDVGSAALLEIGRLAANDDAARDILFDALSDPSRAPSAAAALARIHDPAIGAELGRRLDAAKTEDARRVLVLALKLDGEPAARAALGRFARSDAGSPKLRADVQSWLAP